MVQNNIDLDGKVILVTGAAGFIGSSLAGRLAADHPASKIIGIDNVNDYYDVSLKEKRLSLLESNANFTFIKGSIADKGLVSDIFNEYKPQIVVNLAAQTGVRYSLINPDAYIESNLTGFYNILEACRHSYDDGDAGVLHLVYASSSSVYGNNKKIPYSTDDRVDNPVSLYAATKKSNELMAHAYSKLYDIPCTGLRFFTVYGPYGRPDMAYFSFTDKLRAGQTIRLFNYGKCRRDFTYIDDIVLGVLRVMNHAPQQSDPAKIYNIGHSTPVKLSDFIETIEQVIGRKAICKYEVMQPGDVPCTYADTTRLEKEFGFRPDTSLQDGIRKLYAWYVDFMPYLEQEDKQ